MVAQGFTQIEGIDYNETLRPRRKVRLAPHNTRAIAAERNLEVDAKSAYLNGDLHGGAARLRCPGRDGAPTRQDRLRYRAGRESVVR